MTDAIIRRRWVRNNSGGSGGSGGGYDDGGGTSNTCEHLNTDVKTQYAAGTRYCVTRKVKYCKDCLTHLHEYPWEYNHNWVSWGDGKTEYCTKCGTTRPAQ